LSTTDKSPSRRGKALHDATHGQFGDEPRVKPMPEKPDEGELKGDAAAAGRKAARDKSRTAS
jgi:hypothetical protein